MRSATYSTAETDGELIASSWKRADCIRLWWHDA